jgi:hypothetical protein
MRLAQVYLNPPLEKEGREDFSMRVGSKSPSIPLFQRGKFQTTS